MKKEEIKKRIYNIPQLKEGCKNYIDKINNMLSEDIRVIGLREKLQSRLITLNKVMELLDNHNDLQPIEEPEDQMFDHNSSLKICERCGDNEISKNNDVFCDKCIQQIDDEFDDLISI